MAATGMLMAMMPMLLGIAQPAASETESPPPMKVPPPGLSIMAYNVKGLPWPLASDRSADFARIEARLLAMRAQDAQPHVIILQEAFTEPAKAIARHCGYRFVVEGPSASFRCRTSEDEEAVPPKFLHDAPHAASGKGSATAVPAPTAEWIQSVAACAAAAARKIARGSFSRAFNQLAT